MAIEPLGQRTASYRVSRDALEGPGTYRAEIRLMAGMVPPNLIHEISEVGFDYNMTAREVAEAVVAGLPRACSGAM